MGQKECRQRLMIVSLDYGQFRFAIDYVAMLSVFCKPFPCTITETYIFVSRFSRLKQFSKNPNGRENKGMCMWARNVVRSYSLKSESCRLASATE